ncbi:DUF1857-domain-containing protein [Xylariomycetidae sp. FL2044]|nr:DUF1857-domain-containing protein [Xylariomycetidae sp. FL2044]
MVTLNLAYTAPINPAGATPTLTPAQIWAGLRRKVRRAQEFVPVILSCEVLSTETLPSSADGGGGNEQVVREVQFAAGDGRPSGRPIRETCVHYAPCRVVFLQEDGSSIVNVVSRGPEGELYMTYVFEWRRPEVEEGSEEAKALEESNWKMAKMAVEGSIDTIRRLVKEGEIQ